MLAGSSEVLENSGKFQEKLQPSIVHAVVLYTSISMLNY